MRRATRLLWIWILWFCAFEPRAAAQAQALEPRQVAAPASDIVSGIVRLPDPADTPVVSGAAILPLAFARRPDSSWSAEVELPIERGGEVALALLSPDAGAWRLFVAAGSGALRPIDEAFAFQRRVAPVGDEMPGWVVSRYDLRDAPVGRWTVRVEAPSSARAPAPGWLVVRTASELRIAAYVTTHQLVGDEPIAVVARISDTAAHVDRARLIVETQGQTLALAMQDDGLHEDGGRGDGIFGAWIPSSTRGEVRARVEISGSTGTGAAFLRTAQLAFPVLERALALDGPAQGRLVDESKLRIEIRALPLSPRASFHVSAEVWGRASDDTPVPVCWLSRQVEPTLRDGVWILPLDLDLRWLDVAQAHAPLELRHVRVQDPSTEIVFDRIERLSLDAPVLPLPAAGGARTITSEMLTGGTALTLSAPAHAPLIIGPKPKVPALMLVHGYCSGGNVWPAVDFTQPKVVFLDPNANRTHDQFAQRMWQTALSSGINSFGVVAHSQGGAAALHLLTYYHSGLDFASGGRRIQSVATPYQGTPLASLGAFACGTNNNMTPAGAATWLAGIPSWARAEVYFWTTANSGSACNFFTDLLLSNPEDGTVERFRGDLPGGNSMGHVTGWCHTTGMSNPANYTDHVRNQAMNAAAAR